MRQTGERLSLVVEVTAMGAGDLADDALYVVLDESQRRHEAHELANARELMLQAVDSMSDGFVLFGPDDRILLCNQVYASTLEGFESAEALVGVHVEDIIRRQVGHGQPVPAEFLGDIDRWVADRLAHHRRADGRPHVQELTGAAGQLQRRHQRVPARRHRPRHVDQTGRRRHVPREAGGRRTLRLPLDRDLAVSTSSSADPSGRGPWDRTPLASGLG